MEAVAVILGCLSAAAGAYLATGAMEDGGSLERRLLGWWFLVLRQVRRLARTRLADALLSVGFIRARSRRLSHALVRSGAAVDERAASVVLACGAMLFSGVVGLLMGSIAASVVTLLSAVGATFAYDTSLERRARREAAAAMPEVYRTLSVALASGQTLAQAVTYVGSRGHGRVCEAFARMSMRLRCGSSTEDAVRLLADELDAPGVELLSTALVISHRTGSPLRDLLMRSAALAERREEFERMLGVKTAQVRLSVRIVCLLPVVMIAILALISPDFQEGLATPAGVGCVALAAALDGLALLLIRRLMRGVLRWM